MTDTWPASLPQSPLRASYSQTRNDSVIRSSVGYGPDKLRRRTTADIKNVQIELVLTIAQVETLQTFYDDTIGAVGIVDWVNHLSSSSPLPSAQYRFTTPPEFRKTDSDDWSCTFSMELLP